jgi:hypothetical protein
VLSYHQLHGYDLIADSRNHVEGMGFYTSGETGERGPTNVHFNKPWLLRKWLPRYDWLLWLDLDTIVTDMDRCGRVWRMCLCVVCACMCEYVVCLCVSTVRPGYTADCNTTGRAIPPFFFRRHTKTLMFLYVVYRRSRNTAAFLELHRAAVCRGPTVCECTSMRCVFVLVCA